MFCQRQAHAGASIIFYRQVEPAADSGSVPVPTSTFFSRADAPHRVRGGLPRSGTAYRRWSATARPPILKLVFPVRTMRQAQGSRRGSVPDLPAGSVQVRRPSAMLILRRS